MLYRLLFLLLLLNSAIAQDTKCFIEDPTAIPRERFVDFLHMKAEVKFVPEDGKVMGKVTHSIRLLRKQLDTLFIDAENITIKRASIGGDEVPFKTSAKGVTLMPESPIGWHLNYDVVLEFEASPQNGMHFIGWNDVQNISRKQIWAIGPNLWLPCYTERNEKFTMEMVVTFDAKYHVQSNGELMMTTPNSDGTKTWHYELKQPTASYLMMLVIGEYAVEERKGKNGVTHKLYYYPDQKAHVAPTYRNSRHMMNWLERELGVPYPYGKTYSQIPFQDFNYGAVETVTSTMFADFLLVDKVAFNDRNYISINCHELAHQWFGDYLTILTFTHNWLQEGFATHYAKKYMEQLYGEDHYQYTRHKELEKVMQAAEKDNKQLANASAGSARRYNKGSLVLDMFRYVYCDEAYRKVVTHYLKKHAHGNVDTHDFYRAFVDVLGEDVDWFFDQWILHGGEPHYRVNYTNDNSEVKIKVEQIHAINELTGNFKMPIWFEVHYTDGTVARQQQWIENRLEFVYFENPNAKDVAFVLFDPNRQVIKRVTFDKPFHELRAQAQGAPNMIDRYDAVVAMQDIEPVRKRQVLMQVFGKEKFHMVKEAIIEQLVTDTDHGSYDFLKVALGDPDIQVRKALVAAMDTIYPILRPGFEKLLKDSSYVIREQALDMLCADYPAYRDTYLKATQDMMGWRGRNIRIKWLEISAKKEPKYMDDLVALTTDSYDFETRGNALKAFMRLNTLPEDALPLLFEAALNWNNKLATDAGTVLRHFRAESGVLRYYKLKDWTSSQLVVLQKWLDSTD